MRKRKTKKREINKKGFQLQGYAPSAPRGVSCTPAWDRCTPSSFRVAPHFHPRIIKYTPYPKWDSARPVAFYETCTLYQNSTNPNVYQLVKGSDLLFISDIHYRMWRRIMQYQKGYLSTGEKGGNVTFLTRQESNQRMRLKEALRKCALLKNPPAATPSDFRKCSDFRKSTE